MDSAQQLDEAERVFSVIAAQTAVAIERAWLVRRVEHKRRLEAIGEVAAGVAHELRNPLFGISSAAQLLRFRAREDPVVEKNVTRILREVDRLNKMVTSLLDFGRPATAYLQPGDPEALWDEVLEVERERLLNGDITLRRDRPPQPVRAMIDMEQLKQVYLNILVNAVRRRPRGQRAARCIPACSRTGPGAAGSPTAGRPLRPKCSRMSSSSSSAPSPAAAASAWRSASASWTSTADRSPSSRSRKAAPR